MKKISNYAFASLVIYSAIILYKSPTISDALVILGLAGLSGFLAFLDHKKEMAVPKNYTDEIAKLEYDLAIEKLRFQVEDTKFNNAQRQAARDEMVESGERPRRVFF